MFGNAASSCCVYGCRAAVNTCRTGPSSTTRPAYITTTRSHITAATDSEIVGDQDDRKARVALRQASGAVRGFRPGGCGGSPWSARPRAGAPFRAGQKTAPCIAMGARCLHAARKLAGMSAPALRRDAHAAPAARRLGCRAASCGQRRAVTSIGSAIWSRIRLHRVERVHRALEHDRDLAPPVARQLLLRLRHAGRSPNSADPARLDRARSPAEGARGRGRWSSCRSRTRLRSRAPPRRRAGSSRRQPP